jgi:putative transposase
MPRHARIDVPGAVHHAMIRGITRSAIFYDTVDLERFIDRAGIVFAEGRLSCYAFALLSNHVHLLLRTGITPIATSLPSVNIWHGFSNSRRRRFFFAASILTVLRPEVCSAIFWYGNWV